MSRRAGFSLAEALCALALVGVLTSAATGALVGTQRRRAAAEEGERAARIAREGAQVAAALLDGADAVRLEGDTAAAFGMRTLTSAACAHDAASITLPPPIPEATRSVTRRRYAVEAGDRVALLLRDTVDGAWEWWTAAVDSVTSRSGGEPCGVGDGWLAPGDAGLARARLFLAPAPDPRVRVGAAVRVSRAGRLALYHAGRGEWMLGWRRCGADGTACGAVQPVAGPLRTPATGGFRLAWDVEDPGVVRVSARAPRGGDGAQARAAVGRAAP